MALYQNQVRSGIIGHAIGDALGVPVEFKKRADRKLDPVTDMRSYGTFRMPAGTWSDDTSLEIALMHALIDYKEVDYEAIMNYFLMWLQDDMFTATGVTFDVGGTCRAAIQNYIDGKSPLQCGLTEESANGNGSLMRILPAALLCHKHGLDDKEEYKLIRDMSSLTHAHQISVMGCFIYSKLIHHLMNGLNPERAYAMVRQYDGYGKFFNEETRQVYARVLENNIAELAEDDIKSTGYVVHSLEAAIWCLLTTDSYKEAVPKAVNLGGDTDTIGAITGSMAGIYYGYENIPSEWIKQLARRDDLIDLCDEFAQDEIKI